MDGSLGSQGIFLFCVCPAPVCARKHHRWNPAAGTAPLSDSESAAGGDRAWGRERGGGAGLQKAGQAGEALSFSLLGRMGTSKEVGANVGRVRASCWRTPREVKKREDGGVSKGGGAWRGLRGLQEEELGAWGRPSARSHVHSDLQTKKSEQTRKNVCIGECEEIHTMSVVIIFGEGHQ